MRDYAPPSPDTPQRRLLQYSDKLSTNKYQSAKSLCPSPTPMFQQLYHAVAYWEKQLEARTPTHDLLESENGSSLSRGGSETPENLSAPPSPKILRRVTIPSVNILEYDTLKVVKLDPVFASHTDLDDISQPENGQVADVEISASDSESEPSVKEEEPDRIEETPYAVVENEVLGSVRKFFFFFFSFS